MEVDLVKLGDLLDKLLERCNGSGVGIVRLDSSEIIVLKNRSGLPDELLEVACGAAVEMFRGKLMTKMLDIMQNYRRGDPIRLESVRFTFSGAYHWMTVIKGTYIVVLAAPKAGTSAGYTETVFKSFLSRIGAILP